MPEINLKQQLTSVELQNCLEHCDLFTVALDTQRARNHVTPSRLSRSPAKKKQHPKQTCCLGEDNHMLLKRKMSIKFSNWTPTPLSLLLFTGYRLWRSGGPESPLTTTSYWKPPHFKPIQWSKYDSKQRTAAAPAVNTPKNKHPVNQFFMK